MNIILDGFWTSIIAGISVNVIFILREKNKKSTANSLKIYPIRSMKSTNGD